MSGVWGWFGGQSAQKRKDTPKNAILGLRSQLEMLQKRERHLQNQMDEQDAIARKNVSTNKNGTLRTGFKNLLLFESQSVDSDVFEMVWLTLHLQQPQEAHLDARSNMNIPSSKPQHRSSLSNNKYTRSRRRISTERPLQRLSVLVRRCSKSMANSTLIRLMRRCMSSLRFPEIGMKMLTKGVQGKNSRAACAGRRNCQCYYKCSYRRACRRKRVG